MKVKREVQKVEDVGAAGAQLLIATAQRSIEARGRFVVALSGGSTPLEMYDLLVQDYRDAPFWIQTSSLLGR